jgi:hypothetical protein
MTSQERYFQDTCYGYAIQGESQGGDVDSSPGCFYLEESRYAAEIVIIEI